MQDVLTIDKLVDLFRATPANARQGFVRHLLDSLRAVDGAAVDGAIERDLAEQARRNKDVVM